MKEITLSEAIEFFGENIVNELQELQAEFESGIDVMDSLNNCVRMGCFIEIDSEEYETLHITYYVDADDLRNCDDLSNLDYSDYRFFVS